MKRRNLSVGRAHVLNRTRRRRKQLKNIRDAQKERRMIYFMQENENIRIH